MMGTSPPIFSAVPPFAYISLGILPNAYMRRMRAAKRGKRTSREVRLLVHSVRNGARIDGETTGM